MERGAYLEHGSASAPVAPDALVEFVLGQEVEELRKDGSAGVHVPSLAGR